MDITGANSLNMRPLNMFTGYPFQGEEGWKFYLTYVNGAKAFVFNLTSC